MVFFRYTISVLLFDLPGISGCPNIGVSVEFLSLIHHRSFQEDVSRVDSLTER